MDKYLRSALTQVAAETRRQLFKDSKDNLAYHLFLKMKKGLTYEGSVRIEFDLQKVSSDFFIDYAGTTIKQFTINGTKIETQDGYESLRNLRFLRFPQENLKADKNEAVILFENVYSTDRVGLHSFVDIDGLQYIYSQGEAYGMNKIFPCFDQPDLKAPLSVIIGTPKDWIAVANQPVCSETASKVKVDEYLTADEQKDYHLTAFKTTPRLSTYLYAFAAGAYDEIICPNPHKTIQMACYCRKALTKYLKQQSEEIFEITKETLNFYETYFDYPYAFLKYDYVFFPETYFGGMENPGLVAIADSLIWKEEVTSERVTRRASLLTHEAAHLWFGDLVTCKWWNDIWLNESFAEFISFFCLDAIKDKVSPEFANIWAVFFKKKGWGYEADQRRTTHPIAGQVLNTDHAETVFDGITYSKGAATIKQLIHLIGKDKFGKAMSSYFRKYEWSNATLHDFIASLQEYYQPQFKESPKSLDEWKAEFLDTAGLNECSPIFRPEQTDSKAELVIRQTAALSYHPTLRHHKMRIAFFNENLEVCEEIDAVLSNTSETKITYDGSKKPKAVLLNYEDETFIKVRLDEHSIALFNEKLHLMKDDLTKTIIWKALFDMVRDGLLSGYKFVEIANKSIATEPSDLVLNFIFNYVQDILNLTPHFLADNILKPSLSETTLQALTKSSDKNRLILLKENLIMLASYGKEKNVDTIQVLQKWLDGQEERLKHIELGTQNKWAIVVKLHTYPKLNEEERKKYFDKIASTDSSNTVKIMESKCEALNAIPEEREKLWKSYHDPDNKLSLDRLEASMSGYNNSLRNEGEVFEKLFFDNVVDVFKKRGNEFAQSFYNLMFPHGENLKYYTEQIEHLLKQDIDNDWLVLSLKRSLDNLEVKKKVYGCYGSDIMRLFFDIKI